MKMLRRRSVRTLTRGGARSWLLVLSLAIAILGVWLLAIPRVVDTTMARQIEADGLADIRVFPRALPLDDTGLAELAAIPGVEAADAKVLATGRVNFAGRTVDADLVGVRWSAQAVDRVSIAYGTTPGRAEAAIDTENTRHGRLRADVGDSVVITVPGAGSLATTVSGAGGSLLWASTVREGLPVVYMTASDLLDLTGWPGYTSIEFLIDAAADPDAVLADLEARIDSISPGMTYWRAATIRADGDWPSKQGFDNFRSLFAILATVAIASGLFVVFNAINTLVRREVGEIGAMKALGATRRDILRAYLETIVLIGLVATIAGSLFGVLLSNLLVRAIGSSLMATQPDLVIPLPIVGLAFVVGIGATAVFALPGILWATRVPVQEALRPRGTGAAGGRGRTARLLARVGFISRSSQIGLRSAARNKGRSVATGLQIGITVGVALAFISLGATMLALVDQSFDAEAGDIHVYDRGGGRPLDAEAALRLESIDGISTVDPIHYAGLDYGGTRYGAWALPGDTAYRYDLVDGRWFSPGETGVAVIGQALAAERGLEVGDVITADRFDRVVDLEIVGIDRVMVNDGKNFFVPLDPWLEAAGRTGPNAFWVSTTSTDAAAIDAAAANIEQSLAAAGYSTRTELRYVERAASRSEAALILSFIVLLGIPILGIGMVALITTLTINALERTSEIGVLRSIGAGKRHLARMFRAEGLALATVGWLLGIPLGYATARLLIWLLGESFDATFPVIFPLWSLAPVLVLTLATAAWATRRPLRRALRMSPGDALRYE